MNGKEKKVLKKFKMAALLPTLKFIINHPLNKQQKLDALFKFLMWQVGSRLVPGQIVYNWINDAKFIVQPGETGFTGNIYCGLYDFSDMAYVLHVVETQDLFIDVGANVGAYTILACASKGASGYCFEPEPTVYQRLIENIRLNDLTNRVKSFCVGLSDQEGELTFTSGLGTKNHVVTSIGESTNVLRIKVLPLDKILVGELPSVLKIDVEG
ncbi:MAG: FkbM family methyltransferase, partial [Acidobacteria bacterium]|nr:FkbM family methyltransferase [Acidobacteriota bacterium]